MYLLFCKIYNASDVFFEIDIMPIENAYFPCGHKIAQNLFIKKYKSNFDS